MRKPWSVNWVSRGDIAGGFALYINLLMQCLVVMLVVAAYLLVGIFAVVRWVFRKWQAGRTAPPQASCRLRPGSLSWKLVHSAWMTPTLILMGLGTWLSFLYIGLRTRNRKWLAWTAVYFVFGAFLLALPGFGEDYKQIAKTIAVMTFWFGGVAHVFSVNRTWLKWRAERRSASAPGKSALPVLDNVDRPHGESSRTGRRLKRRASWT